MKAQLYLILVFCFSYNLVLGQAVPPRVQLIMRADTLAPNYSNGSSARVVSVKLKFQLSGVFNNETGAVNNDVSLTIVNGTISKAPTFIDTKAVTTISFPQADWPGNGQFREKEVLIQLFMPVVSSANAISGDEAGQIIITDHPSNFHTIIISNEAFRAGSKYNPNKPFWIEIGSNFDLLDGPQPNNLFTGVFFHKRDIRRIGKCLNTPEAKNFGLFAGVFQSKTVSTITRGDFGLSQFYDANSFLPAKPDSVLIYKASGPLATKQTVRNTGLFFSPQYRLTNGSANEDGLHIFISLWAELQWQKIRNEKDYANVVTRDSNWVHISNIGQYEAKSLFEEADVKSHYYGVGIPFFYREKSKLLNDDVHLFISPVIGITNQPNREFIESLFTSSKQNQAQGRKWAPFYMFQFRLNEEHYGISFTGEVRGLLKKNNPPFVSLALSKKFDLAKFLEFN